MQPFSATDFKNSERCESSYRKLLEIWNAGLRAYAARLGEDNRNDRAGKLASAPLRTSAAKFRAGNGADGPAAPLRPCGEGWCVMPLASRLQEAVLEAACCVSSRPPPRLSSRAPDLVSDMYAQTVASKQHRATYRAGSTKKSGVRRHSPRPGCRAVRESAARGSQPRHEGGLTRVSARVLSRLPHLTIDPLTHRRTSPCSPTAPRAACGTWPSFLRRR